MLYETIGDFPYVDEASRANALALLLTPVVRQAIPGLVPMACITAPQPGTGKGLLPNVFSVIATGREVGSRIAPKDEDEWRKRITAALYEGSTYILLDNVDDELCSSSLASALTAAVWQDRILGQSAIVRLAQRATWVANGNNLRLGGDIPGRSYLLRLDAKISCPLKQTGFTHPELIAWVFENRGRLLAALLTIAVSWFASGRPPAFTPVSVLGGFGDWTRTIAGILDHAGIVDPGSGRLAFLGNMDEMYELADESAGQWERFLHALATAFGEEPFTSGLVAERIASDAALEQSIPDELADRTEKFGSFQRRLGSAFSRRVDTRHGDAGEYIQRVGESRRATKWRVRTGELG